MQVHFTIASQFYVYVYVELFLYVFLRELNLNIDMLSSREARKNARRRRAIIIARG